MGRWPIYKHMTINISGEEVEVTLQLIIFVATVMLTLAITISLTIIDEINKRRDIAAEDISEKKDGYKG